jgi:hypothetical protein
VLVKGASLPNRPCNDGRKEWPLFVSPDVIGARPPLPTGLARGTLPAQAWRNLMGSRSRVGACVDLVAAACQVPAASCIRRAKRRHATVRPRKPGRSRVPGKSMSFDGNAANGKQARQAFPSGQRRLEPASGRVQSLEAELWAPGTDEAASERDRSPPAQLHVGTRITRLGAECAHHGRRLPIAPAIRRPTSLSICAD